MILTVNVSKRGLKLTNGDVFKALYPQARVEKVPVAGRMTYLVNCQGKWVRFTDDWWDAPYKGGERND